MLTRDIDKENVEFVVLNGAKSDLFQRHTPAGQMLFHLKLLFFGLLCVKNPNFKTISPPTPSPPSSVIMIFTPPSSSLLTLLS